jgi:hypothetical protein
MEAICFSEMSIEVLPDYMMPHPRSSHAMRTSNQTTIGVFFQCEVFLKFNSTITVSHSICNGQKAVRKLQALLLKQW